MIGYRVGRQQRCPLLDVVARLGPLARRLTKLEPFCASRPGLALQTEGGVTLRNMLNIHMHTYISISIYLSI